MIDNGNWGLPLLFFTIVIGIPVIAILLVVIATQKDERK